MSRFADLHLHTNYSDSTFSPEEVVNQAKTAGIECIAITDHDTVEAVALASEAGQKCGIEILPGIELSSEINGREVHILGYLFDYQSDYVLNFFNLMQKERLSRMKKMILKLKELGINNIEFEEVCALTKTNAVGRAHLARLLLKKGWVKYIGEAFEKYLAEGKPVYYPKYKMTPYEAIDMIRKAGGVPVLAHPAVTRTDELIPSFVEAGLKGIEVFYPMVPKAGIDYYNGLATKYGLIATGGSDTHGTIKPDIYIGIIKLPYEKVEQMKAIVKG
ncbi:MAG: PHP domain-containing protein [Candidatus Omnitrophica bacterium]|nr:PHP domain-containing protein [Candidatus Omnitrophota bacterium]